jgi:hypothetical protein
MTPRRERIHDETGFVREVDISADVPLEAIRAEAIEAVRAIAARKYRSIMRGTTSGDALVLQLVQYVRLLRQVVHEPERASAQTVALARIDALLARTQAIGEATEEIEAELAATADRAALFERLDALADDPRWPE